MNSAAWCSQKSHRKMVKSFELTTLESNRTPLEEFKEKSRANYNLMFNLHLVIVHTDVLASCSSRWMNAVFAVLVNWWSPRLLAVTERQWTAWASFPLKRCWTSREETDYIFTACSYHWSSETFCFASSFQVGPTVELRTACPLPATHVYNDTLFWFSENTGIFQKTGLPTSGRH